MWGDTALGLMGGCLEYFVTLGLDFLLDSLSQLSSVVALSVSVSLKRCFVTCRFSFSLDRRWQTDERGGNTGSPTVHIMMRSILWPQVVCSLLCWGALRGLWCHCQMKLDRFNTNILINKVRFLAKLSHTPFSTIIPTVPDRGDRGISKGFVLFLKSNDKSWTRLPSSDLSKGIK